MSNNHDENDAAKNDDHVLRAFMEVDPVFNPTTPDIDVEPWDPHFRVDSFSSLTNPHAVYKIDKVFVDFVWEDESASKLYYFLHDKHGEKMAAEVPPNLVPAYRNKDRLQTFVSIHNFKVEYADPTQYPRYQTYSFVRRPWFIVVDSNTTITDNPFCEDTGFEMYPWLPSIKSLAGDKTSRKMMIDTVGRVIRGGLQRPAGVNTCELWLCDMTGAQIKFVVYHTLPTVAVKIAQAIQERGTIYLTRVKLVHTGSGNLLLDTPITVVELDPPIRKADALLKMTL